MNVAATGAPNIIAGPALDAVALPVGDDAADQVPPAPRASADSLSALERQFAALIQGLTQQLSALEAQLMRALGRLTNAWETQNNGGDPPAPRVADRSQFHRYEKIIADAAFRHELDPLLVRAVIRQESGFREDAVSKAGAVGLMQLMPDTARSLGINDTFDPRQNVEGGEPRSCAGCSIAITVNSTSRWRPTTPDLQRSTNTAAFRHFRKPRRTSET